MKKFLYKIGLAFAFSGTVYLFYGLFNYPIFSKQCTDMYVTVGSFFNTLNMFFAGAYIGFHMKPTSSISFIRTKTNYPLLLFPYVFIVLGILHVNFLDTLDYKHIITFLLA
jgi:hypothetical protein